MANVTLVLVSAAAIGSGRVTVTHGKLAQIQTGGDAPGEGDRFRLPAGVRLEITIAEPRLQPGALATRLTIEADGRTFTLFARDVFDSRQPVLIRDLGIAIVPGDDHRGYAEIDRHLRSQNLLSDAERVDAAPEETYESACRGTRSQVCPVWLGLSRDVRMFRFFHDEKFGYFGGLETVNFGRPRDYPQSDQQRIVRWVVGRGSSCEVDIQRRLEEGVLPIVHALQRDGTMEYRLTAFATLETQPLTPASLRGTQWLAAYAGTVGNMLTEQEKQKFNGELLPEWHEREEEVVCRVRIRATNTDRVSRYAYFMGAYGEGAFDSPTGWTVRPDDKVLAASLVEGRPIPQHEMAVLVAPGGTVTFDLIVPHRPIARDRMEKLAQQDYQAHLDACRTFWQDKLASGARIDVPEPAIDERIDAGLLHCDLVALGMEKDGPLLATIGHYSPIGSESAPIIQFFDSMGWHKIAERSIDFFLVRQREDGFIQSFGGYELETGPTLWTIGEHFRYTRDETWARRIQTNVAKACDYLLQWRQRNLREEFRGRGYGLINGKVADPQDFFHSFMLNGLSYLGLKRIAEMYRTIDPDFANRIAAECKIYLEDIRTAYQENIAKSPVVPLGDGTWVPSFGPWAEYPGPVSLYAEGGTWFSHGAFSARDSLIGALYLVIGEVLDPHAIESTWLLQAHLELMTVRNAGLSQPYYLRHDFLHLKRGEVKQYLKTYYTQMAALQDRQAYTFWEHYFGASQHKTHEEGWFLMQTRWMLWHEDYDSGTLHLLAMAPRKWLEHGKSIALKNCASYFGKFNLNITAELETGEIRATFTCADNRRPKRVILRIPHPKNLHPIRVSAGTYHRDAESIFFEPTTESTELLLSY